MSNPNNETASAHLQALLDLEICGLGEVTISDAIKRLQIDATQTDEEQEITRKVLQSLQELWNRHQFPDTSIKLLLLSIYDLFPAIHDCSLEAQCLFFLMLRVQWQNTGYVAVKKKVFGERLGFSRNKIESKMPVYLQELEDIKAIKAVYIPPRGSDKPCVYQINQDISKIGRGFKPQRISKKDKYRRTKIDVAISQEQVLTCGTLDTIEANKKGSATNTAKKSTSQSKARSSKSSKHNITQEPTFTQDPIQLEFDFTRDPEVPFNDIPGQMDFSDLPGIIPEGKKK